MTRRCEALHYFLFLGDLEILRWSPCCHFHLHLKRKGHPGRTLAFPGWIFMNVITGKMSAAWMVQTAVAMHGTYVGYKTSALSPGDTSNWTYDLGQTTNSSFEMLRAAEWVRQSQLVLIRQNRVLRRASKGRLRWSEQFEPRWWLERREAGRAKPAEEKHGQAEVSCIQETPGGRG